VEKMPNDRIDADYKHFWQLDPGVSHLNHGAYGAVPTCVFEAQEALRRLVEQNPHKWFTQMLEPEIVRARGRLAEFLNASPDRVALIDNVSAGVSAVLASLALRPGSRILVTDHLYGAVQFAVQRLARRTGATIDRVHIPSHATDADIEALLVGSVAESTRLAVIDHISANTCMLFPMQRIQQRFRQAGVQVLWDGAHAPGMIPVDLASLDPDFWVGNFHKWAFAPRGTALLYVRDPAHAGILPNVVSWNEDEGFPRSFDRVGTSDLTAWIAAVDAIDFIDRIGANTMRARNAALARAAQRVVADALGVDPKLLWGCDDLSIRAVPLPPGLITTREQALALQNTLSNDHHIETALRLWNGQGLLRVSAQLYNSIEEFEELGRRLKPLTLV